MNLTQVNNSGSCEPLGDFLHLCYNYKCMCFNLNIKWRHLISITSFKLGHVSIPNKRIFLPLFLLCLYDSSVLQKLTFFKHLLPNFLNFSDPIVEVNAVVCHFRHPFVLIRKIWQ